MLTSHQAILNKVKENDSSSSTTEHSKTMQGHLNAIKNEMKHGDLFKWLKSLVEHIKSNSSTSTNANATGKNNNNSGSTGSVPPTPSSHPTGLKWTLDALSQNVKAILNINSTNTGAIKEILRLPFSQQLTLLSAIVERLLSKNAATNDRENTFESVMEILSTLGPEDSDLVYFVTQPLITQFYNDIPKPYNTIVGNQYRTADGTNNSILFPDVGKAGSNYSRTVTSTSDVNTNLPSPQDVFDKLLKRPDGQFNKHQGGINMMLLYLAIIITHDLFYTDPNDPNRNLTTSYADLSSLYGYNRENQESVRQMKGGLLKNDQWFDKRLVIQPPGVASLMVVFSRNHNYIAKKLLEINENERFSYGPGKRIATAEKQDEELFQTARLVNNGCYANIIIHDYVRTIIGASPNSNFVLNPLATPANPVYGNVVSIEFNTIYRWHAAIGEKDSQWLTKVMDLLMEKSSKCPNMVPGIQRNLINKGAQDQDIFDELMGGFNQHFVHATKEELLLGLPIAGSHRNLESGNFADSDVIAALKSGYNQSASEIGNGLNTPAAMEHVEIAGINQARALSTCYFNEFRKFLNLTTLDTFEDFSEKVEVQNALKELYGTPDRVELFAGLMVERAKPTGLRLPYTMGRAILSDATNLLRNDRILTKELTPTNLTNWGYTYTLGDPKMENRVLPSMLTNLFPEVSSESGGFTANELETLFNVPKST